MKFIILIIIFVLLFLLIILYSNIVILVNIECNEHHLLISIYIYLYRIPIFKNQQKISHNYTLQKMIKFIHQQDFSKLLHQLHKERRETNPLLISLLKKIHIHDIKWHSILGAGGYGTTSLAFGSLWSVKGMLLGLMTSQYHIAGVPNIKITPLFQQYVFESCLACTSTIKVKQFISIFLKYYKKENKNGGTSNTRINDNGNGKFKRHD